MQQALLWLYLLGVAAAASATPAGEGVNPMRLGVDDAGKRRHIYEDAAMRAAFEDVGFDFLMHHIHGEPSLADVDALNRWAAESGHDYILNQENTSRPRGPEGPYRKPGFFFQPSAEYVARCRTSPHFLGVCYDEAEHWATNGVWVTGGRPGPDPHFYDAAGDTLEQAYEGNLHNLRALLQTDYPGFSAAAGRPDGTPMVATEHVFPIFFHLFAPAGLVPIPKYLKETVTPVAAAMALGAAKEYGVDYWACLDLWGPKAGYPSHTPEELRSAMLFAYWTGASRAYVENFNYHDSLYRVDEGRPVLNAYAEAARWFKQEYLPGHPRALRAQEFAPEIVIVRFPDSDWGQRRRSYIRENLYGAENLVPDEQTRYWLRIWHVLSHGTLPKAGLTWHSGLGIDYRFFFPANNVAVYDHLASDPKLYASAKLVFLTGKQVSPECLSTLRALVRRGLTVVTPAHLAPAGLGKPAGVYAEHGEGTGKWVVTDEVDSPEVRELLRGYLGNPDELRYVFGDTEVVFTAPRSPASLEVAVRRVPRVRPTDRPD